MEFIYSLNEIETIAKEILAQNPKKIILFNGEMGAGKTTLIKHLAKQIGAKNEVSSPTFSLVNEYEIIDNQYIYHFDMYRIKKETEALDFGIDDYLFSNNWCFIEWAQNIPNLIPETHSTISIEILDNQKRKLIFV